MTQTAVILVFVVSVHIIIILLIPVITGRMFTGFSVVYLVFDIYRR